MIAMKIQSIIRKLYISLLPEAIRTSEMISNLKVKLLSDNEIYNFDFYQSLEIHGKSSMRRIANSIFSDLNPRYVIDIGCGTGLLLEMLRDKGCDGIGMEYSKIALKYCRTKGLNVIKFHLEEDVFNKDRTFDIAISLEVAEHLPESTADRFIDLLCQLSELIIFTAAPPGQGGIDHVNEQHPSYWISKFKQRNYEYVSEISRRWRLDWKKAEDVKSCYYENLMIFRHQNFILPFSD